MTRLCPVLLHTSDGGRTWQRRHFPDGGGDHLQFATTHDGWLTGLQVFVTHDGGWTWQQDRQHGTILALTALGTSVWTIEQRCAPRCVVSLWGSADAGRTWHLLSRPHPLLDGNAQLVRVSARDAWLLSCCQWAFQSYPYVAMRAVLLVTHDAGSTWTHLGDPCAASPGWSDIRLTALAPRRVWLLCSSQPATDMQPKALFGSEDGGYHWHQVSGTGRWGGTRWRCPAQGTCALPLNGYFATLLMTTPTQGWMTSGRGNLEGTSDGGRTWHLPMPALAGYDFQGPLTFVDPLHGWLAVNCGVYRTIDGGLHWHLWLLGRGCPGYSLPSPDGK